VCLFGIKGKVKAFRSSLPNVIEAPTTKHSKKPDQIYRFIDESELEPKVELFARHQRRGWDSIGNEIDGKDIRDVLKSKPST
jgi:N6-adenosine-specific RNA methylase IME4